MMTRSFSLPSGKSFLLFGTGVLVALALGGYHQAVRGGESYHQFYSFPGDRVRPIAIRVGQDGLLHRLVCPDTVGGTTSLRNLGGPVRVRLELSELPEGLEVHWGRSHTPELDPKTGRVERVLQRGDAIAVHHIFRISSRLRGQEMIYSGSLRVLDQETDGLLLSIPIRIHTTEGRPPRRGGIQ